MTTPTDDLHRLLHDASDGLVERSGPAGPDVALLWRLGRRRAWRGRAAAIAVVTAVVSLLATAVLVVRPPVAVPAEGGPVTYPSFVSEIFPGTYGSGRVFGLVSYRPSGTAADDSLVLRRTGTTARIHLRDSPLGGASLDPDGTGTSLAPDGVHVLVREGVVDLTDGSLSRPLAGATGPSVPMGSRAAWSPDSAHVLVDALDGPTVLDSLSRVVLEPSATDRDVVAAGWRDAATLLGVRVDGGEVDVVTRGLDADSWATVAAVRLDGVTGWTAPDLAYASPDGRLLLLVDAAVGGSDAGPGILVDAATGEVVPFAGAETDGPRAFDGCTPMWQDGQPLRAGGGLTRPGDGATVMRFSGSLAVACVSLAGERLTGSPDPNDVGRVREYLARSVLPVGSLVAAVVLAGWIVVALRRSRRHGERFLPMILNRPF